VTTFKSEVKISGKGIHSGAPVNMVIKPSDKYGIFFLRTDIKGSDLIPATYNNVGETKMRNTTIGDINGAHVQTIEHIMAALFVYGVGSAVIEIDGPEIPILDGSAKEFCDIFETIGVNPNNNLRKIFVRKTVVVRQSEIIKALPLFVRMEIFFMNLISGRKNNGFVKLSPDSRGLFVDATLQYPEKIIGKQSARFLFDGTDDSRKDFIDNFANSRTFGKISEWQHLKLHGMARGADETNVIALNEAFDGTINELNNPDEFVMHKIIDCLGDMFTSGGFIYANMESYKGSHALNNLVLKKLFSNNNNYEIID